MKKFAKVTRVEVAGLEGFEITRTAGRRGSTNTVLFSDDTRGTDAKAFFSLFAVTPGNCSQVGNYRTLAEAVAAAK